VFRNDTGLPCPVNPRDIAHKHNYALKYLAEGKFGAEFWKSSPGVTVIKQKYLEYLKGIDHRLKVLQETPRKEQERGDYFIVTKDLIQVYQLSKTFKEQSCPETTIELAMDEGMGGLYENSSREFQQEIDVHTSCTLGSLVLKACLNQ
jgi:hypothetical protein